MTRIFSFPGIAVLGAACAMVGCSTVPASRPNAAVPVKALGLVAGDGSSRGAAMLLEGNRGATLTVNALGLGAGAHGIHLHEKGLCEGPGFTSAGAHWNPTARKHGLHNPAGAHLGDLPNLTVTTSGAGVATLSVPSSAMMADADGTALVIHAKPDDYRTDPSGSSGDRIACAVIAPPR